MIILLLLNWSCFTDYTLLRQISFFFAHSSCALGQSIEADQLSRARCARLIAAEHLILKQYSTVLIRLLSHLAYLDKSSFALAHFARHSKWIIRTENVTREWTHNAFFPSQSFWAILWSCTKQPRTGGTSSCREEYASLCSDGTYASGERRFVSRRGNILDHSSFSPLMSSNRSAKVLLLNTSKGFSTITIVKLYDYRRYTLPKSRYWSASKLIG